MVRNYIRKGGYGGKRAGSSMRVGHWDEQGGRKAAAEAKEQRKAAEQAKRNAEAEAAKVRWIAMCQKQKSENKF